MYVYISGDSDDEDFDIGAAAKGIHGQRPSVTKVSIYIHEYVSIFDAYVFVYV